MIDEIAYLIGGAAVGFLLNAVFGPRRAAKEGVCERDQLIADIKAKVVDVSSQPSGDGCAPQAIWKIKTVTKPARPRRRSMVLAAAAADCGESQAEPTLVDAAIKAARKPRAPRRATKPGAKVKAKA